MVRFPCPTCGKVLRALEEKAGQPGVCPRCGEQVVTPGGGAPPEEDRGGAEEPVGLLASMGFRTAGAAIALAVVGVSGLLFTAAGPFLPADAVPESSWPLVVSLCSLALLGVVIYGHGTGCPSCGRWWAREQAGKEFLGREVFDKAGVPYGRSTYRTSYLCSGCRHGWSVDEAEEYRASAAPQRSHAQRGR